MKLLIILLLVLGVYAESDHDRIIRLETQVINVTKLLDEHEDYIAQDMGHKRENYENYNQANTKQDMSETKDMITWVIQAIMMVFGGGYLVKQRRRNGNG